MTNSNARASSEEGRTSGTSTGPVGWLRKGLFLGLDANHDSVVIDVPDADWIGGIVDPGASIVRDGFRQDVLGPPVRLRVEAHDASGIHLAGPDLAVLVGKALVEGDTRCRRTVLADLFRI